jgi:hypothetical protein
MPDPRIGSADAFIQEQLDERIREIEEAFSADVVAFNGPLLIGVDDVLRDAVEEKSKQPPRRKNWW